ncbi:MAG: hypothetical protein ACPGOY_04710 [Rhodospirillaceae bacterium]
MSVTGTSGTTIYLGSTTVMANVTAYDAETWTKVGNVQEVAGDIGSDFNLVTYPDLETGANRYAKGSEERGMLSLTVTFDASDSGQSALEAALSSPSAHNVKIELPDTGGTNGTTFYFAGLVKKGAAQVGGLDNMVTYIVDIQRTSDLIQKASA